MLYHRAKSKELPLLAMHDEPECWMGGCRKGRQMPPPDLSIKER